MSTMAESLSMGLVVVGFKILIQMIAFKYPEATECCLAKMAVLRNSFEDDENICMKLLWGFSQAGYSNVNVGIRVWCNLLAPVICVPRYSGYVCKYISRIIDEYSLKCLNLTNKDFQVAIETMVQLYPISERFLCHLQIAAQKLSVSGGVSSSLKLINSMSCPCRKSTWKCVIISRWPSWYF